MYTFKDFVTGKIRRTSGKFVGWTQPTGLLGVRYAVFATRRTTYLVPTYCLTPEMRAALLAEDDAPVVTKADTQAVQAILREEAT